MSGRGRADAELDVAVVGAGLVGLSTAMALLAERPGLRVAVLDKEDRIASHQSGRNSGVLHAGLYYAPGSLKARFCREGRAALIDFAEEHRIPYRLCGKLVVAVSPAESARFTALAERGRENGLAVSELVPDEFRAIEPNVTGLRALHVPESGVIDYGAVAAAYARVIEEGGGEIRLGHEVRSPRELRARAVVVCAGLQADRLAGSGDRIVPFRGDYYTFRPAAEDLVRGLVYPVPDPAFPFLGVHFTRRIDGRLLAGPNAVPALAREGIRAPRCSCGTPSRFSGIPACGGSRAPMPVPARPSSGATSSSRRSSPRCGSTSPRCARAMSRSARPESGRRCSRGTAGSSTTS